MSVGQRTATTPVADSAVLDALPDATAILDHRGTVVAVNRAWKLFGIDNGIEPHHSDVGANYLEVCERSAADGCSDGDAVAAGLRSVLNGRSVEHDYEYPCPSPTVGRWFELRMTPIGQRRPGVLVSHANITRRKTAEQELERRASRDPLTGLANRALFAERLATALQPRARRASDGGVGLVYIDLDRFKPINDTYGHAAGDEMLQVVAARLISLTRQHEMVARLGGDEFAIVVPTATAAGLAALAARITAQLAEPHSIHGDLVTVGASVGTYLAARGETVSDSLAHADAAMYAVKAGGAGSARKLPA